MTVKEIIAALGGPTAVGRRLELSPQAVSLWASQGRIPAERVPALMRMAQEVGLRLRARDVRADLDWSAVCACESPV